MSPMVVTDIKQLEANLRTPDMVRFFECAVALYRLDNKPFYITNGAGVATHVLEYGKVRGLRNITGLAAYTLTLRRNRKLTQEQLATQTSVPVTVISQMENGILGECVPLNPEYVKRVALYLGFSVVQAMTLWK